MAQVLCSLVRKPGRVSFLRPSHYLPAISPSSVDG